MNDELKQIIHSSTYRVMPGIFVYAKVSSLPQTGTHFLVAQDTDEITVVTTEDQLATLDLIERNKEDYKLIALEVSIPFYSVGFLAAVSTAIAAQGLNILIVSTYSKDYILVKVVDLSKTEAGLIYLGFSQ